MLMRKLAIAGLLSAVAASVGCGCCHKRVAACPPPCGVPAGPVAVPAGPPAPAPVTAGFAPAAPCPTCNGH
jgi:hypothetical protein